MPERPSCIGTRHVGPLMLSWRSMARPERPIASSVIGHRTLRPRAGSLGGKAARETFLAYAREHYEGGLPRYVEPSFAHYLKCGLFSEGFLRARCEACGHDPLVAFSCRSRTVCPSCTGRRMANAASAIVDRVLPDVPAAPS